MTTMTKWTRPSSSQVLANPGRRRLPALALAHCLSVAAPLAVGCGGPPASAPATDAAKVSFFVQLPPEMGHGPQAMGDLRTALDRHGLQVHYEYSDLVGLAGTVSVSGAAADVQALLAEVPGLQARAVVWRYPSGTCGDGTCDSDEASTMARGSTCSTDCGALAAHSGRDELENSWPVTMVGADRVWPDTQGEGIHVAVLDTGYDHGMASMHPDRPKNLGFGYNFAAGTPDWSAVADHGTHVAGIIASPRNGIGNVGMAPGVTMHIFQVFQKSMGSVGAADADIIAGIEGAIRNGYHIINMSLGGGRDSEPEHKAVRHAYDAGLLVVVAAGNNEDASIGAIQTASHNYPGAYPESLSVGATSRSETIASFSSTGPTVTLSGPGVAVYSSVPVTTGEREVTTTFTVMGMGEQKMTATLPVGSSATGLDGRAVVACGFGTIADVTACAPLGKVALMQRGPAGPGDIALPFSDKIRNARLQGALAVILYNHRYGDPATAGDVLDSISLGPDQPVPVIGLAAGDGEFLVNQITKEKRAVTVRIAISSSDYATFDGTSMASPAVAGVAALIWSKYPMLTNVQLRQLLVESAVDLGAPGRDDAFGWGRVDALRALHQAAPRARCGDGHLDTGSEICDSSIVGRSTCDDLGYDGVAGGKLACGHNCTSLDSGSCMCVPGRTGFTLSQTVTPDFNAGGVIGTLAVYHVKLSGQPVRGASAVITVSAAGRALGSYQTDLSDAFGDIYDFNPTQGTGVPPGDYTFAPVITKGAGRCRDDQPMTPASYVVRIKS